jgi:predicted nucleotidyltransferase
VWKFLAQRPAAKPDRIDLIIEFDKERSEPNYVHSLFELGEIEADLSDAAGTRVQIMTKDSSLLIANPFLSRSIEKDRRELLKV